MIIINQLLRKLIIKRLHYTCIFILVVIILLNKLLVNKRNEVSTTSYNPAIYRNLDMTFTQICESLLNTEPNQTFAKQYEQYSTKQHYIDQWKALNDCTIIRNSFKYLLWSNKEELDYPIGFTFTVYENIERVARLLRLLYRPHNLYCIHVDRKASDDFYHSIINLARCFGKNVEIIKRSQSVSVKWGYFSVLDSFLKCTKIMLNNTKIQWKYVMNINGKELPLRTNWELIKALKALNGANIVGCTIKNGPKKRVPRRKPSFNVTWIKGSFLAVLRREFVTYIHTSPYSIELLNILREEQHLKKIPDEMFLSTLAYNPQLQAPGACKEFYPPNENDSQSTFVSRFVLWKPKQCVTGRRYHTICMLGVQHLYNLTKRQEFFVNKFQNGFYDAAYDCLEYWILKKMQNERVTGRLDPTFNAKFYAELHCSKNHI
ncbi:beta-1,6-N-acetylglucosaminyltransferase 3 [Schistosoma japonicum]|uniref:Beta-1,6-N-acetylglucosaminyltransferase 3 n=1 Tax=Schistosoma japonicum TaxID=6182 RepID=A0A4Z2D5T1_SCHJA|nr:beta-1,6-N-acetylglucosaminyltransferase 3 [Schistosoma japonicum]